MPCPIPAAPPCTWEPWATLIAPAGKRPADRARTDARTSAHPCGETASVTLSSVTRLRVVSR